MSQGFSLDNQGSGFALDDDDTSLEAILASAGAAEGDDDEDTSLFFQPAGSDPEPYRAPAAPTPPREEPIPVVDDDFYSPQELNQAQEVEDDNFSEFSSILDAAEAPREVAAEAPPVYEPPAYQPKPVVAPVVAPEPAFVAPPTTAPQAWAPEPTPAAAPTPQAQPATAEPLRPRSSTFVGTQVSVPPRAVSSAPQLPSASFLRKALKIVDIYRSFDQDVKNVVSQFITAGEAVHEDEADFVLSVFAVDPALTKTMQSLKTAKHLEPVERAFFIMELSDDTLYGLSDIVALFTSSSYPETQTRTDRARHLVKDIDQLDSASITYVDATEAVLAASLD